MKEEGFKPEIFGPALGARARPATGAGFMGRLALGDHLCCLYDTPEERDLCLKSALRHGVDSDHKVVFVADSSRTPTVSTALQAQGFDVAPYVARGQLAMCDWGSAGLKQGSVEPELLVELLEREQGQAHSLGYTSLLFVGDTSWLGSEGSPADTLVHYESVLHDFLSARPVLAVCLYDRSTLPSAFLLQVMDRHPYIGIDMEICDNLYFDSKGGENTDAEARLQRRLHVLKQEKHRRETASEREAHYRLLVEKSPIGIWQFAPDHRSLYGNPTLCQMLEIQSPEDLSEEAIHSLLPSESREAFDLELTKWAAGVQSSCEVELAGKRGGQRNVLVSGSPTYLPTGELGGFIVTFQDITGSRYRLLADSATDLTSKHTPEGVFLYASPASREVLGYDPLELVGKSVFDFFHPDDLQDGGQVIAAILEKPFQYRFRHKGGRYIWIESACKAVRDSHTGEVKHILVVSRDITERKSAEEAEAKLHQATQNAATEWRSTFDSIESPVLIVDHQGLVQRMNHAAMALSGQDYGESLGRSLQEIHDGEPWVGAWQVIRQVSVDKTPTTSQLTDFSTNQVWEISARPHIQSTGGEERIILMFRDITEQAALQESLRRSELMSAMGSLVAGVAHEVRNPLFAISSTLDAFEARFGDHEDYRPFLNVLHGEVKRMAELMNELLQYGKSATVALSPGSLQAVLEEATAACTALADERRVIIRLAMEDDLPLVAMDRGQLPHVFRNLLDNALRESPPQSRVIVTARTERTGEGEWVECGVEDSGPGFRAEDLPQVLDPFFSRRRGGTGLGLAISQRIVEAHGGRITLGNRPNGGATVTVRLPVARGATG